MILHFTSGITFSLIGFVSAHWNTETYFEQDATPFSRDWGIHQIAATKDMYVLQKADISHHRIPEYLDKRPSIFVWSDFFFSKNENN